jgi:hypothetical protein
MWSGPRNISTALMRAFENREDCIVVDEPLYGYYLAHSGFEHPGGDEIVAAMDCDWRSVVDDLRYRLPPRAESTTASVYYQKHMTQHLLPEVDLAFSDDLINCFLIREPRRIIASYARVRPEFSLQELGFSRQWELFQRVADRLGHAPPVIDSAQTLRAPEQTLRALCAALGIGFSARMLQWPAGRRASDGVWAPHWYAAVEASTGFESPPVVGNMQVQLSTRYESLCEEAEGYYADLYRHALVSVQEARE